MDTIAIKPAGGRRRRRHSPQFKAKVVEACRQPGVSIAAVALANGLNANLVRRWVQDGAAPGVALKRPITVPAPLTPIPATVGAASREPRAIRIDLRHDAWSIQIAWPADQVAVLGPWLKDLLR